MKNGNAHHKITTVLILLISFSLLTTCVNFGNNSFAHASSNAPQATNSSNNSLISTQNPTVKEVLSGNARVVEHKINGSELLDLKKLAGVSAEGQNYNYIIDGYGTGLKPPSEAEWNTIGDNLFLVDSINNLDNKDGSPASADESSKPWFPPIGNQGSQGSCVTWSVGYYTKTFQESLEYGWDLSGAIWQGGFSGYPTPSYQNRIASPAFIYNLINRGVDLGSTYYDAMRLVCFVGDSSWQAMPYVMTNYTVWPSEQAWAEAPLMRGDNSGFQIMYLTTDSALASLKSWISSDHLVTIGVDAYKFANLTSSDLWTTDNYFPSPNHAGTIVGYDDSLSYTENGTTHYGAFKVANSWGVGGWEKVPDGFYWVSYETIKQRIQNCYFYNDLFGYNPTLEATFQIQHSKRSECNIQVGIGNPNSPISTKSFSQYVYGGALPFCPNNIVLDVTEFQNSVSTINGQTFFLRVLDGGTSTTGTITTFRINQQNSNDAPCQTADQRPVYLNLTFGTDNWPMFHHDLQHTGTSSSTAPNTNNTLWSYTTGSYVESSPAVIGGKAYVGSFDGKIYCLNATTGAHIWDYNRGDSWSSPAFADGEVYIGSPDDKIYCLNASNGAYLWSYTTNHTVTSSPAVVNGKVYVGSVDGNVYCLNAATGAFAWNFLTSSSVESSPVVVNGKVYIGSNDNKVYCLNANTGAFIWAYTTGGYVPSSPSVAYGKVYIGSYDKKIYCLNADTGAYIWSYATGVFVWSSPAVADGRVYIGSRDNKVYCLDATTGAYKWSYNTGDEVWSSPAVADGKVYVGSSDNKTYCLNAATGVLIWSYATGNWVQSSPAVADGKVYIGSMDGKVYCFGSLPSLTLGGVTAWYWASSTAINSVASGDVDNDGFKEIVTGGSFYDGTRNVAQLIVWNGSNLAVDRLTTWYWTGNTAINSVAIGDVDGDNQTEIVTGGYYYDGSRNVAQLVVWNGLSLAVERLTTWYWTSNTAINSVAIGNVDGDVQVEIVSGGYYNDGTRNIAQLIEWNGSNLAVDRLTTWYWTGNTVVNSVALGDVDNDTITEVVTGGYYFDGARNVAQLVEWNGANLEFDRLTTWYWTGNTVINSVAVGDVDDDGQPEVVTGGYYNDGARNNAQLVEWVGSSLAVDRLTGWYWTSNTAINSVGIGDVDGDGQTEIVTGGYYNDGIRNIAQLVVWSGSGLAAENIKTWYWTGNTTISSVAVGDVVGDLLKEIVVGGAFHDGTRLNSQLTVWGMT